MLHMWKLALAAALLFGGISIGQASDHDHGDRGGYDIGPLGQCFVPPDCGRGRETRAYAYPHGPGWHYTRRYGWHYGPPR